MGRDLPAVYNIYMKKKELRITQYFLNNSKAGGLILPDFSSYYKLTVMNQWTHRSMNQRLKNIEIDLHSYS